mmetsp:Transcript_23/g.43  ORF Transcript_23/g.43 Transcript_23/m.43 type:complete len:475 (-) Transcript_23:868-2292(-)
MRLQVSAATIAVLSGTCHQWVASAQTNKDADNAMLRSKFARDVEQAYKSDPMGQRQQLQKKRSLEKRKERNNNSHSNATKKVDVGILAAATTSPIYPQFLYGQKRMGKEERQRFLQEEEGGSTSSCPSGCPQEFCDCGATYKEVEFCTKEMLSVCERGLVPRCVRTEDIEFYEETYCPFSECIENNEPEEICNCDYYSNYCTLFYEFEDSFESCVTAECCDKSPAGEKATCIPGLQPTFNPTSTPTVSVPPTASPSGTPAPTVSSMPTISNKPTSSPSISSSPTTSPKPTPLSSDSPSAQPSISAKPSVSPTEAPNPSPSQSPSSAPTVSPTDVPSTSPSDAPSNFPTVSAAPTISVKPSTGPTSSQSPTVSAQPTDSPSISVAPTSSPSDSPTVSVAPTSSPSTPVPTGNPIVEPTMEPTYAPTLVPTYAPTFLPTEGEQLGAPSGGMSHLSNILIPLCVGVGGAAMWLFGGL